MIDLLKLQLQITSLPRSNLAAVLWMSRNGERCVTSKKDGCVNLSFLVVFKSGYLISYLFHRVNITSVVKRY